MASIVRTPEERFASLPDYPFAPRYTDWQGLRIHYVDEGSGPAILMLHGEPTWSYLYRMLIPPLVAAGYRCIAPDYIGFGKSDKITDDGWYVIERHVESIRSLIRSLDLRDITLVAHDWGGPIGLRQAVDMPERFARLVIFNTWLHHEGFHYTDAIRQWRAYATDPARYDLPCGRVVANTIARSPLGSQGRDLTAIQHAYDAPFPDTASKAGARRFPWCLPFAEPQAGNAADQARCFATLTGWVKPAHIIFSDSDRVFTVEWGQAWAARIPGATFDAVAGAGHYPQEQRGEAIAAIMLNRMG